MVPVGGTRCAGASMTARPHSVVAGKCKRRCRAIVDAVHHWLLLLLLLEHVVPTQCYGWSGRHTSTCSAHASEARGQR